MTDTFEQENGAQFIAQDDMIVSWIRKTGSPFEPETGLWMADVIGKKDGAFVDVGASTGWYSIPMALAGYRVVAFEPNERVADRLVENCKLNDVDQLVSLRRLAVSQHSGTAMFYTNPRVPLTSGGSIQAPTCSAPAATEVETVTLDEELDALPVSLIKVDVENHELAVLKGAEGLLRRERPHLVLEANSGAIQDRLAAYLDGIGYSWCPADWRNMLCVPRQ
jgi:FkbM family methyltransferase